MQEMDLEYLSVRKRVSLEGIRKMVCDRMLESALRHPQSTIFCHLNMGPFLRFVEEMAEKEVELTVLDLFLKAAACALTENLELLACRLDEEIVYFNNVNIGVNIIVNGYPTEPVILDIEKKDIQTVAADFAKAESNLRKGRMMRVTLDGANFMLTDQSGSDTECFTSILKPPIAATMGLGRLQKVACVTESGEIKPEDQMCVSLTVDRSIINLVSVNSFLESLKRIAANPGEYMFQRLAEEEA